MEKFIVVLANPENLNEEFSLKFNLKKTSIAEKWKEKIIQAHSLSYNIDDPQRFYGFYNLEYEKQSALKNINQCISIINSHKKIIDRFLNDFDDIDTLNYLHHIFEIYHGLLDNQTNEFFISASKEVKKALSNLNILIHRIESIHYNNAQRIVVTYFGLPKKEKLQKEDFKFMTCNYNFGGLYLNYVEVGKTIEDLVRDNDNYIDDSAIKPWHFFSADFTIRFDDVDESISNKNIENCKKFYYKNYKNFSKLGFSRFTNQLKPGKIKIGQLIYNDKDETINNIKNYQFVKKVYFIN